MIEVGEYKVKEGLYYTKDHEWAQVLDDGTVLVGITDYARRSWATLPTSSSRRSARKSAGGATFSVRLRASRPLARSTPPPSAVKSSRSTRPSRTAPSSSTKTPTRTGSPSSSQATLRKSLRSLWTPRPTPNT